MDPDFLWHTLTAGAMIAAAIAFARLLLDYLLRGERSARHERERLERERRLRLDRAAEARLERVLQGRLAEADRRLEHSDAELRAERVRATALEHDLVRLQQAYDVLRLEYSSQQLPDERRQWPPR
ncbi:MAG TPA: hypothetical protein VGK33_04005 [Chloroflexota bacterium]|jgi:hypothetical protein